MEKIIENMGKVEFGKFYNKANRKILNLDNTPIRKSEKIKSINMEELERRLDNKYIYNLLDNREKINIYETEPQRLLSRYRFDILVKYNYVKSYCENINIEKAKQIYLSHIKAFNNFHEPDGSKNNPEDFIKNFNNLIKKISEDKKMDKSLIPISMTGIPIDGSHRVSIALYFKLKIQYVVFDLLDGRYDDSFFLKRGMPNEYVQEIKNNYKMLI